MQEFKVYMPNRNIFDDTKHKQENYEIKIKGHHSI